MNAANCNPVGNSFVMMAIHEFFTRWAGNFFVLLTAVYLLINGKKGAKI